MERNLGGPHKLSIILEEVGGSWGKEGEEEHYCVRFSTVWSVEESRQATETLYLLLERREEYYCMICCTAQPAAE